ncbi:MAG TPA: PIN domain-containing protein [Terriglobales bacterium]|nr:PIN domain-containing protein [Terriglobales bacterium]
MIVALWDKDPALSEAAQKALEAAFNHGNLVVSAPVFAELMAAQRMETFLSAFFEDTGIAVDWVLTEKIWRLAGQAFRAYAERRRKQRDVTRRILADFLIGAHASWNGHRLLTLDEGLYKAAFPTLVIQTF